MGILGSIPTDFYDEPSAWSFIGHGDSGGPILHYDLSRGRFSILGIISSGACLWVGYYAPIENARVDATFVPKYFDQITAIMNETSVRSATRCISPSGNCPNTAYILNSSGGFISIYNNINRVSGDLGRLSASVQTGYNPTQIKFHPNGKFAYALNKTSRSISMYMIDDTDGSLIPLMPSQVSVYGEPVDMAFDESGKYAYAIVGDNILTFLVDRSGRLRLITTPVIPNLYQPNSIVIIKKYAYVANYANSTISQYSINSAGGLIPLSPALIKLADITGIGLLTVNPTNKFLYIPVNDGVRIYQLSEYGRLDYVHFIYTQEYGEIVNIIFTPRSGKYLYVLTHTKNSNGQTGAKILVYDTDNFDIPSINIIPAEISSFAMSFDSTGKHMYLTGLADNKLNIYDIDNAGDLINHKAVKGNFYSPTQIALKE
jgi:6-phosphogluconolactonase (cycloisomerase 2 family)